MNKQNNEMNNKENNINNNSIELHVNSELKINISSNNSNYLNSSKKDENNTKPIFIKVLSELNQKSPNIILNYLSIKELIILSGVSHSIKSLIEKYFPLRLKIEYDDIKNFELKNISLKNYFLKTSMNIPQNNWFYNDIKRSINTISNLNRRTISQIRGIRKLSNLDEKIYAPLCLIFNYNLKSEKVINNGWKKTAESIMSDSRFFIQISNLRIENMNIKNINQAFNYLNEIEEFIDKVKRFSPYLYELNLWCKAVIIYYFLVHPYKLSEENKEKLVKDNEEVYKFVIFMDEILDKFYYFKGFLEAKKIVKMNLGEYIFYFE